jgi:hypothetical protein
MRSGFPRRPAYACRALVFALAIPSIPACTSVQWLDASGRPRTAGLASIESVGPGQTVTRIIAPGMSLRLIPGLAGYALGWRETTIFQRTAPGGVREVAAFADRSYGIVLDPLCIVIGSEQRFGIVEPSVSRNLVQEIYYSDSSPESSFIRSQEER